LELSSRIVERLPCPKCGSRDNNVLFDDGHEKCFTPDCDHFKPPDGVEVSPIINRDEGSSHRLSARDIADLHTVGMPARRVSEEVYKDLGFKMEFDPATGEVSRVYYPVTSNGELVAYKVRILPKDFTTINIKKDVKKKDLINANNCGGKFLIITEGEEDLAAAVQMLRLKGKNYSVCSLVNGAASVKTAFRDNADWLEEFDDIVLAFDMDEAGQAAASAMTEWLTPGKCRIASMPLKDASDMLVAGKVDEFLKCIWNARARVPDGIVSFSDMKERMKNRKMVDSFPFPDHWGNLNEMTYGLRIGELDTITSGSGMGKTTVVKELEYHIFENGQGNLGIIHLEETVEETIDGLMSIKLGERINLPDHRMSTDDPKWEQTFEHFANSDRIHFFDHTWSSIEEESLFSKIRYMAKALDCKYVVLDHLNIVISEYADQGGERERIDVAMTKLKRLTQELGIWIGLIVHLRKTSGGTPFEEGGIPSLDDLRGSGSIKQLSNTVYALSRNQQHEDRIQRNISHLHVLKCRLTGRTGPAGSVFYNDETGRLEPAPLTFNELQESE